MGCGCPSTLPQRWNLPKVWAYPGIALLGCCLRGRGQREPARGEEDQPGDASERQNHRTQASQHTHVAQTKRIAGGKGQERQPCDKEQYGQWTRSVIC